MKRVLLPEPPNPDAIMYRGNPMAWMRAVSDWMHRTKGLIEDASRINDGPIGQAFVVGSFTTNTMIDGTTTGTDLSNFVASLVQGMTDGGRVSARVKRTD